VIIALVHRLAHVETYPNPDRRTRVAEGSRHGGLDRLRARRGASRRGERQHEPVPLVLDDRSAVVFGRALDDFIVRAEDVEPPAISEEGIQS
jgi:hypothetical protein